MMFIRLQLTIISSIFSISNEKNKNRIEWYLWKHFFRNFQRHPLVTDDRTNAGVGHGNGMARTSREVITFYRILRRIRKNYELHSAIDLGCGDGVALRYFEMSGYSSIGIEFDPVLSSLAMRNNPKSHVITGDITDDAVVTEAFDFILSRELEVEGKYNHLIYAFNPISPALLLDSLNLFAKKSRYVLLLKNPTSLPLLLEQKQFKLKSVLNNRNLAILEVEKI